jgi:hypothetical protein
MTEQLRKQLLDAIADFADAKVAESDGGGPMGSDGAAIAVNDAIDVLVAGVMASPRPWPKCVDCPQKGEGCDDRQCFNAQHRRTGKVIGPDGQPAVPA